MKIQYMGTAAAEGIPAIFCQCDTCRKSRERGGRNIRTRSQAIIDDKILIDLPADTYMHALLHGIDMSEIKTCLITHDHPDHLYPVEIANRRGGYAHIKEISTLDIYCTQPAYCKLADIQMTSELESDRVRLNKIKAFDTVTAEGYEITALKANHSAEETVIYAIEKDGKTMLYGHDSGIFPNETWEFLKEKEYRFDFVSLDCTFPLGAWTEGGHMTLKANKIVTDKMKELKLADDNTVFAANHFTHNGGATYEEIKKEADKMGMLTSYDGMIVEF